LAHLSWLELFRLLDWYLLHDGILAVLVPYSGWRVRWMTWDCQSLLFVMNYNWGAQGLASLSSLSPPVLYQSRWKQTGHRIQFDKGDQVMLAISVATAALRLGNSIPISAKMLEQRLELVRAD
jgi:hypothetical protein